jgi:hypothetical protein
MGLSPLTPIFPGAENEEARHEGGLLQLERSLIDGQRAGTSTSYHPPFSRRANPAYQPSVSTRQPSSIQAAKEVPRNLNFFRCGVRDPMGKKGSPARGWSFKGQPIYARRPSYPHTESLAPEPQELCGFQSPRQPPAVPPAKSGRTAIPPMVSFRRTPLPTRRSASQECERRFVDGQAFTPVSGAAGKCRERPSRQCRPAPHPTYLFQSPKVAVE